MDRAVLPKQSVASSKGSRVVKAVKVLIASVSAAIWSEDRPKRSVLLGSAPRRSPADTMSLSFKRIDRWRLGEMWDFVGVFNLQDFTKCANFCSDLW